MRTLLSIAFLAAAAFSAPNYQLVWSDEFNYTGLPDPSKWDYDVGGNGWGNKELEYYKSANPKNSYVNNGTLKITVNQEETSWTASNGAVTTNHLSSARLVTRGKQAWKYGRFEARMKLPKGRGMWPAFWMIPTRPNPYGGWPTSGEIDVMENYAAEPTLMHGSAHTKNNFGANSLTNWALAEYPVDNFHVYALDWRPDTVTISVDGNPYFQYTNPHTGYAAWPFDQPFYVILNVAVNGVWGDTNYTETKYLPQSMIVDYVRVYQDAGGNPITYAVTANQTTGGTVTVSPVKASYNAGDRIQISAMPSTGYVFSGWTSGTTSQLAADYLTVSGNTVLAASFAKIPDSATVTVTQSIGGYTCVRPVATKYAMGSEVKIYALPLAGYKFTGWISGAQGKLATDSVVVAANIALRASYAKTTDSCTVVMTQNVGGTISISPALSKFPVGSKIRITATPNTGNRFSSWSTGSVKSVDSLVIDSNKTLSALFVPSDELVPNGGFDLGWTGWQKWNDPSLNSTYSLRNGMACVRPGGVSQMGWYTQLSYAGFPVLVNNRYEISFVAKATAKRKFTIFLSQGNSPFGALTPRPVVTVDTVLARQTLILSAGMSENYGRVEINYAIDSAEICLDSVSVKRIANQAARTATASVEPLQVRVVHQAIFVTTDKLASWSLRTLDGNLVRLGMFPQAGMHTISGVPAMVGILTLDTPDGIRQSIRFSSL